MVNKTRPLIQDGQLSVTGKSISIEYCLNCVEGLILFRYSVVRLTDHLDMTTAVYCGHKATTQHHVKHMDNLTVQVVTRTVVQVLVSDIFTVKAGQTIALLVIIPLSARQKL